MSWVLLGLTLAASAAAQGAAGTIEEENAAYLRLLSDWGKLTQYGSENAELRPPAPGVNRVVFFGDDVIEKWDNFFPGKPYLNRGITHQATPQMLVRFRQDVIALQPKVVVILGGTNDLAGYAGPATEGTIADNIMTMTELAQLHGIQVILASVTPICDCKTILSARRPQGKIIGLNGWIKGYAAKKGAIYADLYSVLAQGRNFRQDLTVDGLIPNAAGYALLAPVMEKAITAALSLR
ncbi:MAG TPA: GDSL-type esterase/lipase family protein [Bryobacteraceae bacterium]|nr:GDSL-type esterase/lipase family protein [Bryobacteraceae bacterium]